MKRIVALVLAVLTLTTMCLALTPEEAARDLGKYGIMGGFPDGSLRLEQNVTRAQMAKMLVTAMKDRYIAGVRGQFADVPDTHWAKDYINFAAMDNIVGGVGNGLFKPEDNVTCEQAIKMVVCMLKYDEYEKYDGGGVNPINYPSTYLEIAHRFRITENIDYNAKAPATRGFVAVLLSRALDEPIAVQEGIKDGLPVWVFSETTFRDKLEQ